MNPDSPDRDPSDSVEVSPPHDVETVFVVWLRCEGEDCTIQKPLFAQWSATTTEAERRADIATWRWENLRCPAGHAILRQGDYQI